jgi:hypothetical protein
MLTECTCHSLHVRLDIGPAAVGTPQKTATKQRIHRNMHISLSLSLSLHYVPRFPLFQASNFGTNKLATSPDCHDNCVFGLDMNCLTAIRRYYKTESSQYMNFRCFSSLSTWRFMLTVGARNEGGLSLPVKRVLLVHRIATVPRELQRPLNLSGL